MPSQQRFEGPDLEALLDEVRDRFGPDVAIVEANKIRTGGVGGFFAREAFEVVIDADAPASGPARASTPAPPRARTLLDLVDDVDDGPAPVAADALASEETVRDLLRRTGPSVSTDGSAFADVLDRIARATQAPAPPTDTGSGDDAPFRTYAETAPVAARPERGPAPAPVPAPLASPEPAVRGRRRRDPDAGLTTARDLDLPALRRLGLPDELLHGAAPAGLDRLSALVQLAERFPRPHRLPDTGDTVIALVGDRSGMERAVAWVHEQLGLAPERLMLASRGEGRVFPTSRRIETYDDAAAHRRAWRRSTRPVLVVVDEPVGLRGTAWSRHVLDALEPSAVWAVVDAQRKPEDVVEWGERIGGIDAVALDRTEETSSPAAILTTGLPVSLIDGHTASPARWAAVLDERLLVA